MATRTDLIAQFPEFADAATDLLDRMLAAAALEIDADIWLAKYDQGQMYLAAHKLALSPYGNSMQLVLKQPEDTPHGSTIYGVHYDSLVMQVASGFRVA
jgi:hypothetical protein